MQNYLIIGSSSGIGRLLAKRLADNGNTVIGVARRVELLETLKSEIKGRGIFIPLAGDFTNKLTLQKIQQKIDSPLFKPDVIVFCAAIFVNDLTGSINMQFTKKMFNTNYFGVLDLINNLLSVVKPGTQFIAISSSSAFKGNALEGLGYPSSKAALSISFESLHQNFKKRLMFKTIFLGPVASGMGQFVRNGPFFISEEEAVDRIIKGIGEKKVQIYHPSSLFLIIRLMKLFPSNIYFWFLTKIEKIHNMSTNKVSKP